MKTSCTLELDFADEDTARNIARAIELDNGGYINAEVRGKKLLLRAESDSVMSLRNTVDDVLACITVAQKSLDGTG